ncbi:MAG: T9SS type A sorting domain-containing protein [Chitinophagaceae bacterium]
MKKFTIVAILLNFICVGLFAQIPRVYTSENTGAGTAPPPLPPLSQLPVIDPLPDPFMWSDGSGRSTNFSDWEHRRNEIKAEIENYEIGVKPNRPETITATYTPGATPTAGTLRVEVTVNGQTLILTSQVSLPAGPGPFPAVIGMNNLNGSIPADIFTSRNIARITFSHNNVTTYGGARPTDPFFRLYPDQNVDNTGQYAAWSWGVSRLIDGLELVQSSLPIDLRHLAVTGCSYAGKMALFAGAFDERIALTIAQESGGGGAPAWRVSETIGDVEKLGATDHNWFKESMFQFSGLNVSRLPHDHHELMAMVAPRALLVTGNTDFLWLANPSTYVSARAAKEVYKTFGISERMGFYIDGGHNHCAIPTTQRPAIEAFVDKFLLDKNEVITDTVTINPYPSMDYESWYKWWGTGNPVFPNQGNVFKLWLEPECGTIGSNWDVFQDPTASKGAYVMAKLGLNSTASAPKDTASNQVVIPFTIDSTATYNFLGRCIGATATDDSYWVRVDNGPFVSANGLAGATWQWGRLTTATLSPGQHTFTITYREDGAKLDKVLITTSTGSAVIVNESPGVNCGPGPVITPAQAFSVSETAANNSSIGNVLATDDAGTVFQKWTITGGTGALVFAINANTGELTVLNNSTLDFESATRSYDLTLTVNDGYFTSAVETITINLTNANDNSPVVAAGISFALDGGNCSGIGAITATDADDTNQTGYTTFKNWTITGGTGKGIFAINTSTGAITIADLNLIDLTRSSYTLFITVGDGANTSAIQTMTVTIPDRIKICHNGHEQTVSKFAAIAHIRHGDCIGSCGPGPDYPALKVSASPNPTTTNFQVTINNGNPTQTVGMKVYSVLGRLIEQNQNLQVGQSLRIGQNYQLGLYLVEFTQGLDKEVLLLLKLR